MMEPRLRVIVTPGLLVTCALAAGCSGAAEGIEEGMEATFGAIGARIAPAVEVTRLALVCRGYRQASGRWPMWPDELLLALAPPPAGEGDRDRFDPAAFRELTFEELPDGSLRIRFVMAPPLEGAGAATLSAAPGLVEDGEDRLHLEMDLHERREPEGN